MKYGENESMKVDAFLMETLVDVLPKAEVAWSSDLFTNNKLADLMFAAPGKSYSRTNIEGLRKEEHK